MTTENLRVSTKRKLLIGVVVVVLAAIGFSQLSLRAQGRVVEVCTFGDWPLEWAVRRQFANKQPELRAIINFVNEAPEIAGLTLTPAGLRASLHSNESEQHELDQPNILQALVSMEAHLVNVHEDRVSVFLGSEVRGATSFEVSYIYPTGPSDIADCRSIAAQDRDRIGACAFQLTPQWHILYQWYPHDLDELEEAIDDLS
jgi:hypothetical protein